MPLGNPISIRGYLVCYEPPEIMRGKNLPHTARRVEQKSIPGGNLWERLGQRQLCRGRNLNRKQVARSLHSDDDLRVRRALVRARFTRIVGILFKMGGRVPSQLLRGVGIARFDG